MLHEGEGRLFTDIAYEVSIRDLIDQGYLCPLISKTTNLTLDVGGVGSRGGEFIPGQLQAAVDREVDHPCRDRRDPGLRRGPPLLAVVLLGRRACDARCLGTTGARRQLRHDLRRHAVGRARPHHRRLQARRDQGPRVDGRAHHRLQCAGGRPDRHAAAHQVDRAVRADGRPRHAARAGQGELPGARLRRQRRQAWADRRREANRGAPAAREQGRPQAGGGAGAHQALPELRQHRGRRRSRNVPTAGTSSRRQSKIAATASTLAILSTQPAQWMEVSEVSYRRHDKPGKPPSMRVDYRCGLVRHSEWICFEHPGYARQKAVAWWQQRSAAPVPATVSRSAGRGRQLGDADRHIGAAERSLHRDRQSQVRSMHRSGLCAVCRREPRGFGWFDARYRVSDARRDTSRRELCSSLCQDLCHRRTGMIDPTPNERAALLHGAEMAGEYLDSLSSDRPGAAQRRAVAHPDRGRCHRLLRPPAGTRRRRPQSPRCLDAGGAVLTDAPNFMARFGARLVANGYSIVPIQPGTKKPGCHRDGQWRDYPGWTRHADPRHDRVWSSRNGAAGPRPASASSRAASLGVDIDIAEDAELALRIEQLARERLGDTPALRIGQHRSGCWSIAPRRRSRASSAIRWRCSASASSSLPTPIHPGTGRPYDWPEQGLADLDIGSLPAIDEEQARAFLEEAIALLPQALRPATLASPARAPRCGHAQQGTPEAVEAALTFIPNADLDYDSWVRIGLALKGALGDAGADLFAAWSAQSAKNVPAFTAKTWAGFRPTSIGAGTIYHLALERGWKPDAAIELDGSAPHDAVHPAAGMLAKIKSGAPIEALRPEPASFNLVIPDGLVGDLTRYMISTARRPQPLLSLGASLCAVGALMGGKYRTESNLRSNLYIVGVADFRLGQKSQPRGHQRTLPRSRPRRSSRRQQDRFRRRPVDGSAPAAGDPVPDRRVRHVPVGGGRPAAQSSAHHGHPRQHDRTLHRGRRCLPWCRICQPRWPQRPARHQSALPVCLWHN